MSKIKTKNTIKDIKILDKAASGTAHMKNAFIRSKQSAESTQESEHHSGTEYATDRVTGGVNDVTQKAAHRLNNPHKKAAENLNRAKEQFQKARLQMPKARKEAAEKAKQTADHAVKTADTLKNKAEQAQKTAQTAQKSFQEAKRTLQQTRAAGRQTVQHAKQSVRTAKQTEKTIKTSAKTAKATGKGTIKTVKQSVKTAERTTKTIVKTAQHTAKAAQQSAKAAAKAAKTAERAARVAAKTAAKTAKAAAKAVTAMVKATIAALKGLVSSIAAGGSVAVIVIVVICLIALLVGSAYGIFFSGNAATEDSMPLSAVQSQIQAQYSARITEIESSVSHDAVIRHGEMPDFVEVVAVFAVLTTTRSDGLAADVVIIDADRAQRLADVFWDMCEITYEVVLHVSESVNDAGETVTVESRVLHITTTPKTYEDMPDYYNFTRKQTELLYELMENRDLLTEVIGQSGWYTGGAASVNMTDAELYELAAYYGVILPENLSIERKNVLAAAFAGVQINIPYHYDWRSYYRLYPGIEGNDFGNATTPDYKGRSRKGTDCSGFVGWAYYTGGITWSGFGYGESGGAYAFLATPGMRGVSAMTQITAENLKPGDIGFISNSASGTSDHTGIYLGTTSGGARLWLHCAGSSGAICSTSNFSVFYTVSGMDATFGERKVSGTIGQSDVELLAQLIYYEGRGYNSYCQELIAQVAVNRVKSSKFPNTLTEVLQQPGQYGYGRPGMTGDLIFNADISEHREFSDELWQKCLAAAQKVADGTSRDENGQPWPGNVLYQHSFANPEALGPLFKSYSAAGYTEYFCFG